MTEPDLTLIGKNVLEGREDQRRFRDEVLGELRGLRDEQTVMIRMLLRREAEIDTMRALEQRYESLRAELHRLAGRVAKLEPAAP